MKLLFDQNLSHRLPARLADLFPDSAHVRLLGKDRASDNDIWQLAKDAGFVIVTQDSDFIERIKLFGPPPNVVRLRCGNTTPAAIETLLREQATAILELAEKTGPDYLELF